MELDEKKINMTDYGKLAIIKVDEATNRIKNLETAYYSSELNALHLRPELKSGTNNSQTYAFEFRSRQTKVVMSFSLNVSLSAADSVAVSLLSGDTTLLYKTVYPLASGFSGFVFNYDTALSAGTHSYMLEIKANVGVTVRDISVVATGYNIFPRYTRTQLIGAGNGSNYILGKESGGMISLYNVTEADQQLPVPFHTVTQNKKTVFCYPYAVTINGGKRLVRSSPFIITQTAENNLYYISDPTQSQNRKLIAQNVDIFTVCAIDRYCGGMIVIYTKNNEMYLQRLFFYDDMQGIDKPELIEQADTDITNMVAIHMNGLTDFVYLICQKADGETFYHYINYGHCLTDRETITATISLEKVYA